MILKRIPYFGDELRIDGYYHSNLIESKSIGVAVFYRNGFCIHTLVRPINQDTINYIENKILLNRAYIDDLKNTPSHIGVFQIMYPDIEIETWDYGGDGITTFTRFGKIINDTTFIINKMVNNGGHHVFSENLTYRFKQFSPKPDSTNVFIK
jgi:hypothetical protein